MVWRCLLSLNVILFSAFSNLSGVEAQIFKKEEVPVFLGKDRLLSVKDFHGIVFQKKQIAVAPDAIKRLDDTRAFIEHLLAENIKVYGLTTGFGDLREKSVSPVQASLLSRNIILSHDAGIGKSIDLEKVRGAMLLRAYSLSKGYSGFKNESLQTLVDMINRDVIPEVPSYGSLGASGDLALLSRLGHAMMGGKEAFVYVKGVKMTAEAAFAQEGIKPFVPEAKEGLALTNGTSFMASGLTLAYLRQLHIYENMFALLHLYLNATRSIDAAFYANINDLRYDDGQTFVASLLFEGLKGSPLCNRTGIQNDYSQRCLPQIFGPKVDEFLHLSQSIFNELEAVTDNPLIFRDEEISQDVNPERIINYKGKKWCILSGGNFHGEKLATYADILAQLNAKICLTLERHLTFLNNPSRNKGVCPIYLIKNTESAGLLSGFMIPQYVANDVTRRICQLANPMTNANITSSNEAEDIVSYGNAAIDKLNEQLDLMEELLKIYAVCTSQAYSLTKQEYEASGSLLQPDLLCERIFALLRETGPFPVEEDVCFKCYYERAGSILKDTKLREATGMPLSQKIGLESAESKAQTR